MSIRKGSACRVKTIVNRRVASLIKGYKIKNGKCYKIPVQVSNFLHVTFFYMNY